jgi:hypothetical protein
MGETSKAGQAGSSATLGFLTVVDHEQWGLIGGYLILSPTARPLEFHCTAPVKPSRAQQILYGPTLAPYLYGEQIAQTLIGKAGVEPAVVWTDRPAALCVRDFVSLRIGLVLAADVVDRHEPTRRADPAGHYDALVEFALGRHRVAVAVTHEVDRERIVTAMAPTATFDICEPFERIREAIEEVHRASANRAA